MNDFFFKIWKPIRWRMFLPLLHLHIEIPLISVMTSFMRDKCGSMERDYIALQIRVHKWSFEFALYDTWQRKKERRDVAKTDN